MSGRARGFAAGVAAMFLYAAENLIIEKKLSAAPPQVMTFFFYAGTVVLVAVVGLPLWFLRERMEFDAMRSLPPAWYIMVGAALVIEPIADYFLFDAYHQGASIATVATLVALYPVVAALIASLLSWQAPSLRQVIGCLLVPLVMYLVKG